MTMPVLLLASVQKISFQLSFAPPAWLETFDAFEVHR
jgi:hypothetical protein